MTSDERIAGLLGLIGKLLRECREHNNDYHWQTPDALITEAFIEWLRAGGVPRPSTESLGRCAEDVIRLSRATIPEEVSEDSWFVIRNLVFMALESVDFAKVIPVAAVRDRLKEVLAKTTGADSMTDENLAALQWQPIETYRGNDYVLLLSSAHGRVIGGHVTGDVWHLVGVGAVTSVSERPTHWMPLPDFPRAAVLVGGVSPKE